MTHLDEVENAQFAFGLIDDEDEVEGSVMAINDSESVLGIGNEPGGEIDEIAH